MHLFLHQASFLVLHGKQAEAEMDRIAQCQGQRWGGKRPIKLQPQCQAHVDRRQRRVFASPANADEMAERL